MPSIPGQPAPDPSRESYDSRFVMTPRSPPGYQGSLRAYYVILATVPVAATGRLHGIMRSNEAKVLPPHPHTTACSRQRRTLKSNNNDAGRPNAVF